MHTKTNVIRNAKNSSTSTPRDRGPEAGRASELKETGAHGRGHLALGVEAFVLRQTGIGHRQQIRARRMLVCAKILRPQTVNISI
jgi:hypothetical protein